LGSTKRNEYLASRRNCCNATAKTTWDRATLKIIAAQRLRSGGDPSKKWNKMDHNDEDQVEPKIQHQNISTSLVPESSIHPVVEDHENEHVHDDDDDDMEKNFSGREEPYWSVKEEKKVPEEQDQTEEAVNDGSTISTSTTHNQTTTTSSWACGHNNPVTPPPPPNLRSELIKAASVSLYHGEGFEVGNADSFELYETMMEHYDPWMFETVDEDGHERLDVHIVGTSRTDTMAIPHVMSPMLMHALQQHLPYSQRGESFWLKYSLIRDGASTLSFLQRVRGSQYTFLACETVHGEVFGFFATQPWIVQPTYFGTGESFLWKMKHSRILQTNGEQYHNGTLLEQAQHEGDIDVYPCINPSENRFFQLCQHHRIGMGGGDGGGSRPQDFGKGNVPEIYQPEELGFALIFDDGSLLHGSSSACMTFQSPPLSSFHGMYCSFGVCSIFLKCCLFYTSLHVQYNLEFISNTIYMIFLKRT
jgi:hypothetical protein